MTYSTPVFYNTSNSVFNAFELFKKQLSVPVVRKARVNFHSIEDIVYGGNDVPSRTSEIEHNDSGFSSFHSSKMSTPSIVQESSENMDEASSDIEEDKENQQLANKTNANSNDGKKVRTSFTDDQKKALDVYFRKNPYPDPKETEDLSKQLVLPENVIKVWFQNKRSRDKQRKFSNRGNHKSQMENKNFATSSPIVANLQLLTSRLNSYAALAAFQNNRFQNAQNFM